MTHGVPLASLVPGASGVVTGVCLDSRRVRPGDLYVGLPGARTHGARFAADAARAGAIALLTDAAGADDFAADWLAAYRAEFPQHALTSSALVSRPSGPQGEIVA